MSYDRRISAERVRVSHKIPFCCMYVSEGQLTPFKYQWEISVEGPQHLEDTGKILDFSRLKKLMKDVVPDNQFICSTTCASALQEAIEFALTKFDQPSVMLSDPISAESICTYLVHTLQNILDREEPGVYVVNSILRESVDSYVTWQNS